MPIFVVALESREIDQQGDNGLPLFLIALGEDKVLKVKGDMLVDHGEALVEHEVGVGHPEGLLQILEFEGESPLCEHPVVIVADQCLLGRRVYLQALVEKQSDKLHHLPGRQLFQVIFTLHEVLQLRERIGLDLLQTILGDFRITLGFGLLIAHQILGLCHLHPLEINSIARGRVLLFRHFEFKYYTAILIIIRIFPQLCLLSPRQSRLGGRILSLHL